MSKKVLLFIAIIGGLSVGLLIIGRLTGAIQWFRVPSGANRPTINVDDNIFSSNLVTPKRFDFICFYHTNPELGRLFFVHRLCGMPGDTLEIKNGDLYINQNRIDTALNLNLEYIIPEKSILAIADIIETNDNEEEQPYALNDSSMVVTLSKEQLKKVSALGVRYQRYFMNQAEKDPRIAAIFKHDWEHDNFGPAIIPANHYFVLGDNRNRAMDSRYIGFISKDSVYGTVLGKH